MLAEIITIGDEILIGQTVDTNSAWLGEHLNAYGVEVIQISSINDKKENIGTSNLANFLNYRRFFNYF